MADILSLFGPLLGMTRDVWDTSVFGMQVGVVVSAILIFAVFFVLRGLFTRYILVYIDRLTARTENTVDDRMALLLRRPLRFVFLVLGLHFALYALDLSGAVNDAARQVIRSLIAYGIFWVFYNAMEPASHLMQRFERIITAESRTWLVTAMRGFVVLVGVATVLEIWGIAVAPILAGLGVGGVAIALGAQDLLKNVIGGMAILAERRFRINDWIKVDGVVEGTVEHIGYRSTRIRRFDMAPVFVPNNQLSDGSVTNFSAMTQRRIYWMIGVTYATTVPQLRKIRDDIAAHIRDSDEFDHSVSTFVRIDSFSESSIDIMVYCFTKTTDWGKWLEVKESFAYAIAEIVRDAGSSFAFPSRSVYLESLPQGTPVQFVREGRGKGKSEGRGEEKSTGG